MRKATNTGMSQNVQKIPGQQTAGTLITFKIMAKAAKMDINAYDWALIRQSFLGIKGLII